MSAFRRAGAADTGTRPGLHGQTLVSMGLVDLDRVLGGGLPLSSVLLVLEDPYSGQHLNLMRYFMAEGVACRQNVMWLSALPPAGGPAAFLPAEASTSQSSAEDAAAEKEQPELRIAWQYRKYIKDEPQPQRPQPAAASASTPGRLGASASASTSTKSSFARAGAAVAAGVGREWCHSYDLTRPMGQEALGGASLEMTECSGPGAYTMADERAGAFLSSLTPSAHDLTTVAVPGSAAAVLAAAAAARRGPEPVGRLLIESVGSLAWWAGSGCSASLHLGSLQARGEGAQQQQQQEVELLRLLYNVRQRALRARCAVMVTVPAGLLSPGTASRLPHLADSVLALDPLSDDSQLHRLLPDPASAVALLSVRKLCSAGMLGPRACDGVLHVVRHKRRRLGLSVVEVDPDAEERLTEATARAQEAYMKGGPRGAAAGAPAVAGAVGLSKTTGKSSAALLCGGPPAPGGGSKALDF